MQEKLLQQAIDEIDICDSAHQKAKERYDAIGRWLERPESTLASSQVATYTQGSFSLGTVIKPIDNSDDYDIDLVCDWVADCSANSPSTIKTKLGFELQEYARSHSMKEDVEERRRCWTIHYASSDGEPGFHLDAMPAVDSNSYAQRNWNFENNNDPREFAVAITDNEDAGYERVGEGWLASNPRGYAVWFHFQQRDRRKIERDRYASAAGMATEDVPEFKIKTPLQRAIQFLKRHRDKIFEGDNEVKPISIIITTLVAQCYSNEDSVEAVIASFIENHEQYIEERNGVKWISNPINPDEENFADKWPDHPERRQAFYFWMEVLRNDFANLALEFTETAASERIRDFLHETTSRSRQWSRPNISHGLPAPTFNVGHKQAPPWTLNNKYKVRIRGEYKPKRGSFMKWSNVAVNQTVVPIGCDLRFIAIVEAPKRKRLKYKWQVVNTGSDAANARGLRGDFYTGLKKRGGRVRTEESSYEGFHWVQCFVLDGNECVGVSEEFIVNIK